MQTNTIHTAWWDWFGRDLAKLWCRIPAIWSMSARGSVCGCLSLAIYQSDNCCLSLEKDHARWWDGRAETHRALTGLSKQNVLTWIESRLPPLPAWPVTWSTLICLIILFRVLGGSCGASFWRLKDPVSIVRPSALYLMQQKVEHKVSPCPMCLWSRCVQFPIAFPATGGFYSTAMLLLIFFFI